MCRGAQVPLHGLHWLPYPSSALVTALRMEVRMRSYQLLIGGRFVDAASGKTFDDLQLALDIYNDL